MVGILGVVWRIGGQCGAFEASVVYWGWCGVLGGSVVYWGLVGYTGNSGILLTTAV